MNITLYQAASDLRDILDQIDPETGELPDGYEQARDLVATKAQAAAAYILQADAEMSMLESHVKDVMRRVKNAKARNDWLRQYLRENMATLGISEIKDERGLFKVRLLIGRDEAIDVFDAKQIPADYLREVPAHFEPDKALIKRAIKDGFDVPGARLDKRDRLEIKA